MLGECKTLPSQNNEAFILQLPDVQRAQSKKGLGFSLLLTDKPLLACQPLQLVGQT